MSYFPWSDEYSVHLRVIDNDHKDLVFIVNALHDAICHGSTRSQIGQIIGNLAKYVDEHFRREEALMETYGYPGLARHRRLHRQLARTVHGIRIIFGKKPNLIDPGRFLNFLRDWLIHHILEEDTKYAPYLRGDMDTDVQSDGQTAGASAISEPETFRHHEKEVPVTLSVPASKAAALRRCARILSEGGDDSVKIEEIVMPLHQMTFEEAIHFAGPVLHEHEG